MMTLRALAAFLVLPGTFGFLLPLAIAQLDPFRLTNLGGGVVIVALGALILLWCVRDFYVSGKGTLAPWDPPKHLVVVGLGNWGRVLKSSIVRPDARWGTVVKRGSINRDLSVP